MFINSFGTDVAQMTFHIACVKKKKNMNKKKCLRTYFWGSNILSSKMQDVGSGIATGAANACCTPTTGGGTPGTDSPENA